MSLPSLDDLTRLAQCLAGDFSNQEQAWENPPLYAQIQVCYRPLPWAVFDTYGFYVEQAYIGHLQDPYRTAVVALALAEESLIIRNYRPLAPERWQGSPRQDPSRLEVMRAEDVGALPGCDVQVFCQEGVFGGETQPGRQCRVVRQGQPSYLHTTVEISPERLVTHDRGFDPETHEQVWGALAGPFVFRKMADWSAHLPDPA